MPQYFYHLRFELYATPAANARKGCKTSHRDPAFPPAVPRCGSDIFKTSFPAHRINKWSRDTPTQTLEHPAHTTASRTQTQQSPAGSSLSEIEPRAGALLLPERSLRLRKDVPPSPKAFPVRPSNAGAATDWRYDSVCIESIDMEGVKSKASGGGGLHTKAVFVPLETVSTDVGYGVVHLYRDVDEAAVPAESAMTRKPHGKSSLARSEDEDGPNIDDCTIVGILAVPSWMLPSDLLGFIGDQAREDVSHFRLIRTGRANKYMVLMKFRTAKKAREWQKMNNGRVFSAAEPENCHVVLIKSVEFISPEADVDAAMFPRNTSDPFTEVSRASIAQNGLSSKPMAPPPPNLLELPTCPVCLERMDETTGLLTILCQHVFHCACLEKWRGSGCPVCRYSHSPSFTFPYPRPHDTSDLDVTESEPLCSVCASTNNLWICLICGNIGCGRYDSAHAFAHYESTSHCYAMDVSTQRVWDYAGDGYVHRLIQNKSAPPEPTSKGSSELSSRPRHENEAFRAEGGDSVPREKMENMANEYAYLLTSQLEGQRRYFEEQVGKAVDRASEALARAEETDRKLVKAHAALEASQSERQQIAETLARVEKALERSEKTRLKLESLARDVSSQLREEKSMNEGLLARVKAADEHATAAQKEVEVIRQQKQELEEMNHDLTMFISSQEKVKELHAQGVEVMDGDASVPDPVSKRKGKGRKK